MDPGTNVLDLSQLRRSCSSCALSELCLPAGIGNDDMERLDTVVRDKRTLDRGGMLYRDGDPFEALYVVRAGSLKTFVQDDAGDVQILGFGTAEFPQCGVDEAAGQVAAPARGDRKAGFGGRTPRVA